MRRHEGCIGCRHCLPPLLAAAHINAQRGGDVQLFVIRQFVHSEDKMLGGSWRQLALNGSYDRGCDSRIPSSTRDCRRQPVPKG
jgi:hypothetical protein